MKIENFNKFNEIVLERLLENAINESIVYYSPELRKVLKAIKNDEVCNALLKIEGENIKNDVTFIDIDKDKVGYLTFTRMTKAIKNLKEDPGSSTSLLDVENEVDFGKSDYIFNRNLANISWKDRNPIKITRIVSRLLGDKFTASEVDLFSRKFMAKITVGDEYTFEVVEGDDIAFWYKEENYSSIEGDLGSSCMRNSPSYYFKIYTENPEVCRLVILLDNNEKLVGRALLWKIGSHSPHITSDLYYMDRQYTVDKTQVQKFRDFAFKNNWAFKTFNSISKTKQVTYNNNDYDMDLMVEISGNFNSYPYMDTFKRYSITDDQLHNDNIDEDDNRYSGDYILTDTSGGYTEVDTNRGVWSEHEQEDIDEDYAVYSYAVESYLDMRNAIEVTMGSRRYIGWYPDGSHSIVYDELLEEWIHEYDSVFSEVYNHHILEENAAMAIISIYKGDPDERHFIHITDSNYINSYKYKDTAWFKRLSYDYPEWDNIDYLNSDLVFKNYKGDFSLLDFKLRIYNIVDLSVEASKIGFTKASLLSLKDSKILNCKINAQAPLLSDHFDYNKDIEDILQEYYDFLKTKEKEVENILDGKQMLIDFDNNADYISKLNSLHILIIDRKDNIKEGTYNNDIDIEG